MTGLLELADGCEQATGPDRDMDSAIAIALGAVSVDLSMTGSGTAYYENASCPLARFTASLDAAMTLVPEGWCLQELFERNASGEQNWRWKAELWNPNAASESESVVKGLARMAHNNRAAPALALCAAALRARAQHTPESKQ